MISVAMTTYNGSRYLIKQLESILNQTRSVDEVVIVDDHSSDDTCLKIREFIEEHKCENWKLILHNTNKGFIKSFEDAISETNGDIIVLCDHDDIWHNRKIEIMYNTFTRNKHIKALATSFWQIDDSDNIIPIKNIRNKSNNNLIRRNVKPEELNKMNVLDVLVYNISPGCTCAFSKSIKDLFFSIKTDFLPHDWKLLFIAACLDGLYYLDIKTTYYRIYSNNTIGLKHVSDFQLRKNIADRNYKEKTELNNILKKIVIKDKKYLEYSSEIKKIYFYRTEIFNSINIVLGIRALCLSLHYNGLYQTVLYDIYVVTLYFIKSIRSR